MQCFHRPQGAWPGKRPAPQAGIKEPPLQGDQSLPPERAPTLAETAPRVREQEVFSCDFPLILTSMPAIV
jgi:hypothetical protein